jgi:hypothetical protein
MHEFVETLHGISVLSRSRGLVEVFAAPVRCNVTRCSSAMRGPCVVQRACHFFVCRDSAPCPTPSSAPTSRDRTGTGATSMTWRSSRRALRPRHRLPEPRAADRRPQSFRGADVGRRTWRLIPRGEFERPPGERGWEIYTSRRRRVLHRAKPGICQRLTSQIPRSRQPGAQLTTN